MSKYNYVSKKKAVKSYLNCEDGYNTMAKKYGIKSPISIANQVKDFKEYELESLRKKAKTQEI
ncbi:hypothetical protein [Mycoplasma bradburyae]|uniref:hypothetical protein n=1 Tax=Mycoplasma bradburyae TaxID=2963128 RepID=UPI0023418FE3|nr:hypothetical protein [Mycoplasma bradburyae]MDC4183953.1 hypothetical protein [Mycoplasma bradburyae]